MKEVFSIFQPFCPQFSSKLAESGDMIPKILLAIIQYGYKKTENFKLISVEKCVTKMHSKK